MKEPMVEVSYALIEKDILNNELGRLPRMTLSKALEKAERMLRGSYVLVTIRKEVK